MWKQMPTNLVCESHLSVQTEDKEDEEEKTNKPGEECSMLRPCHRSSYTKLNSKIKQTKIQKKLKLSKENPNKPGRNKKVLLSQVQLYQTKKALKRSGIMIPLYPYFIFSCNPIILLNSTNSAVD